MTEQPGAFRVGFAAGVMPDKWARTWAERMPRRSLAMLPLDGKDGIALLRSGDLHMCFVRLPVDRDGLHLIPLYDEQPVVMAAKDHPVAAYDRIDVADLADEHRLELGGDEPARLRAAVADVADEQGVLVVPMSLARLAHRRDVVHVPVDGVPTTTVGLAWQRELDDDRVETFIGIVRGRTANSSRGRRPG